MTLRFAIPNSGLVLEAEQQQDLVTQYAGLGGDRDFLLAHVKRSLTAFEHGPAVASAVEQLNAHVIGSEGGESDAEPQQMDDPWESHPSERTTQPAKKPFQGGKASQPSSPPRGDPAQYMGEDRFGNKFYRDPNAPECQCGVQSIRGAFTSQQGKRYGAYVCFDAGPKDAGSDYRNKCEFRQFINKK